MAIYSNRFSLCITNDENLAICHCDFTQKDMVKAAGFRWHQELKKWTMAIDTFKDCLGSLMSRLGLCNISCKEFLTGVAYRQPICNNNGLTPAAINTLKIPPYAYQSAGINFALENPYCVIGDEMGLGKTPQGIGVLAAFNSPSVVICPAFLKYNWAAEIERFYGAPTCIVNGTTKFDSKKMESSIQLLKDNWPIIFIINYEIIKKFEFIFKHCRHWVIDEAHALKNPEAERTKIFAHYLKSYRPKTCTFLTGTAVTNSVSDFYQLLAFVGYSPMPMENRVQDNPNYSSWFRFSEYFSHSKQTNFGTKYLGVKNWIELRKILEGKYIRRSASEYLPDLPELTRSIFTCRPDELALKTVDAGLKAAYDLMKNGMKYDPENDVSISSAKRGAAVLKAQYTAELANSLITEGEKVIIFSDHVEPCQVIAKALGNVASVITGDVKMDVRHNIVSAFQDASNRDCMAIVATYGALATGVTLTAARNTIANDLPWIPGKYAQAEKRFHRVGQKEKCIVRVVSAPGLDTLINKTILSKALTLSQVLSFGNEKPLDFK